MPAFAGAVALGYRYVETDVHVTADGVVLAFHDDELDRVTDRAGDIAELTWSECPRRGSTDASPSRCSRTCSAPGPSCASTSTRSTTRWSSRWPPCSTRTGAVDRVCIGSFSDRRLDRLRADARAAACAPRSGPAAVARLRARQLRRRARTTDRLLRAGPARRPRAVTLVDERFVATAHALDLAVHVWTIDEPDEMDRLLDLGVDGIMTDRPAVLRDVLERRASGSRPAS